MVPTVANVFALLVLVLSYLLNIHPACAILHYSRVELLDIDISYNVPETSLLDFHFSQRLDLANISREGPAAMASHEWRRRPSAQPKRKLGKRGGLHARLKARATKPPLPSLLVANVCSLENKMDELRTRVTTQREKDSTAWTVVLSCSWKPGFQTVY